MAGNRRPPEEQALGACFWCDQMCFPGAVRIQGPADYLLLHADCCARLQQECGVYGERAQGRGLLVGGAEYHAGIFEASDGTQRSDQG